jgi:hypothetical protein
MEGFFPWHHGYLLPDSDDLVARVPRERADAGGFPQIGDCWRKKVISRGFLNKDGMMMTISILVTSF